FTCCAFGCATIYEYESSRRFHARRDIFEEWSNLIRGKKQFGWRDELNKSWNNLRNVEKVFVGIVFVNASIYLCWRSRKFQATLTKMFTDGISKDHIYLTMVTSMFSHYNFFHMAINMYVLNSFAVATSYTFKCEEFLAFYLSAGVFSSFFSRFVKSLRGISKRSLGASGAVLGLVACTCIMYPQSKLGIVFIPNVSFSAQNALIGIILVDIAGILFRWRFIDHAAHLGGTLFGV
ncbi:presenilins-associated rhomboid-like protein: mitochondrial, partial [Dinothrombium tinctorium]